jgi:hypothetical protein
MEVGGKHVERGARAFMKIAGFTHRWVQTQSPWSGVYKASLLKQETLGLLILFVSKLFDY